MSNEEKVRYEKIAENLEYLSRYFLSTDKNLARTLENAKSAILDLLDYINEEENRAAEGWAD